MLCVGLVIYHWVLAAWLPLECRRGQMLHRHMVRRSLLHLAGDGAHGGPLAEATNETSSAARSGRPGSGSEAES